MLQDVWTRRSKQLNKNNYYINNEEFSIDQWLDFTFNA